MTTKFITIHDPLYQQALKLRYDAFYANADVRLKEVFLEKPYDELEEVSDHLVLLKRGKILAHGRLTGLNNETGKITRLVVDPSCRRKGYGTQVMQGLIDKAREEGFKCVVIDARVDVISFYEKMGFVIVGEEIVSQKTGLVFRNMELPLV